MAGRHAGNPALAHYRIDPRLPHRIVADLGRRIAQDQAGDLAGMGLVKLLRRDAAHRQAADDGAVEPGGVHRPRQIVAQPFDRIGALRAGGKPVAACIVAQNPVGIGQAGRDRIPRPEFGPEGIGEHQFGPVGRSLDLVVDGDVADPGELQSFRHALRPPFPHRSPALQDACRHHSGTGPQATTRQICFTAGDGAPLPALNRIAIGRTMSFGSFRPIQAPLRPRNRP